LGYQLIAEVINDDLGWRALPDGNKFVWRGDLRDLIARKNQLFFNRWRPENSTYLFLFRKHEQGKNAQEIPLVDPLIQAEEEKIAKLRREPLNRESLSGARMHAKQTPVTEH